MTKAPLWTAEDAAIATDGRAIGDWSVTGVSIDSRSLKPGEMFVPLKDARDGHDFIDGARENGAGAIMSERQNEDTPALIVDETILALHGMAAYARQRSRAKRIAVTGSVGKTSVKDALAHILAGYGPTHKSIKSYNNHWGVPLTLANMAKETEFGVFETGMNHAGELTQLSKIVMPDVALITTVAPAHLAHFENVKAIADAKAEIMLGLKPRGVLILNADNQYTPHIKAQADKNRINYITFGRDAAADVHVITSETHADGSTLTAQIGTQSVDVTLNVAGKHWVSNAAACLAVIHALDLDLDIAAQRLEDIGATAGRGAVHNISIDGKSVTVIDDSYNANPTSMAAAIAVLGAQAGRKLAVLGDMFELGKDELAMHAALTEPLEAAGVARVIVTGECMRALRGAMPQKMRGAWTADWAAALDALSAELIDGDVVLVKGSNSVGLSKLVDAIIKSGDA
ncbi:UDP-N-acetylmuramoyl-tripeptide--D-alanyl-D-alanine ligase [Fretibacter rubidus]|uniref:UDP-N-acetylmuramoyl-tripeptide--D-alanyl-D- alanine ligase n=1 Tax=Fretibacter rubidus TaxID=570162 RepID=UPI003529FD35